MNENVNDLQLESDVNALKTRAAKHKRDTNKNNKLSTRYANTTKCNEHYNSDKSKDAWSPENTKCKLCTRFVILDIADVNESVLPRVLDVLNLVLTQKSLFTGKHTNIFTECAEIICSRWVQCNVYPLPLRTVERHISDLFESYRALKKFSSKSNTYWTKCTPFLESLSELFDIAAGEDYRKAWEIKCNVKNDFAFYNNQKKNPPVGYSTAKVDTCWEKSAKRKEKRNNRSRNERYADIEAPEPLEQEEDDEEDNIHSDHCDDSEFVLEEVATKKQKYEYKEELDDKDDELPHKFRHIRSSFRSVRPEVYQVITKMKSMYHMSQAQAEGAVVEVGNALFGRKWKFYHAKKPTDSNTLPAGSNMRRVEPYMEAMALSSIAEEIMSGSKMVVTYSNDGSAMSGVGNYVVQSFTINNVQRVLPTFSIFTESRESLKELEIITLKMLCAATGYKYTEQEILANIDFVMTDSTSHNLTVMESVCEEFNVKSPKALTCNVHPLMMMQRKVKEIFRILHDTIGSDKVKECFLSDIDFANDDFITKAITCLSNFINRDYSAKPWNRQSHFDNYIKPRKNMSITLKDHRFNRIFACCEGLVYHIDDIASYLDKYRNIVNGISILDRSFVEMPILKPIFCAVALIGIHITKPFQALLIDVETKYSTLAVAFPKLYDELTTVDTTNLCTTSTQAFHFVSQETFESCIPDKDVCEAIDECSKTYAEQVVALMNMIISKIADGFDVQRGAIFGFGTHAEDDTGPLLKVSDATEEEKEELDKTTVHNLAEERTVGSMNNELHIRGKRNLESASRKLVLNKSFDLIEKKNSKDYLKFRKPAQAISALKTEWHEKMKVLEDETFADKDHVNTHLDSIKYQDLEFLKSCGGPFTTAEEVQEYTTKTGDSKEVNKRLYIEVRYAKNTSLRLKHTDPVFRLKRNSKNLLSKEYAENLMNYLGTARKTSTISVNDLQHAICKITGLNIQPRQEECPNEEMLPAIASSESSIKPGEHVAVFWIEKANEVVWYLGIVDKIVEDRVSIIHLKQSDKKGQNWVIPDDAEVLDVDEDQIIVRNISVMYLGVSCRIELSKATTKEICDSVEEIKQNFKN